MSDITNKTAIITGASRGIGAATAVKLASKGINIAAVYAKNKAAAEEICSKCEKEYNIKAKSYQLDVSDFEESKRTVEEIIKDFGSVELLVNNAGITRDALIIRMSEADFNAVINTNLKGAFNMIRHCMPHFLRNRFGRIVNISSVSGLMGNAGQINYSASKAGIIGITKTAAREMASRGVTCNAVAPGLIDTDMTLGLVEKRPDIMGLIPLGRSGKPEDVADAVYFLLSSAYITGEIIKVDGGMNI